MPGSILDAEFMEQTPLQFCSPPGICVMFSVCLQRACVNSQKLLSADTSWGSGLFEMTRGHVTQTRMEVGECMMLRESWFPQEATDCWHEFNPHLFDLKAAVLVHSLDFWVSKCCHKKITLLSRKVSPKGNALQLSETHLWNILSSFPALMPPTYPPLVRHLFKYEIEIQLFLAKISL